MKLAAVFALLFTPALNAQVVLVEPPAPSGPALSAAPAPGPAAAEAPALDFDVLVVGSGYGGSPAALGFAEAGFKVGVLERGQRHSMGAFPRGEDAYWEPEKGRFGTHNFRDLGNNVAWTIRPPPTSARPRRGPSSTRPASWAASRCCPCWRSTTRRPASPSGPSA